MTSIIWDVELKLAMRRPRVAILSAGVPLLLVAVVALGHAPPPHAALVYTVLFTFFGTFGAAVPWARDEERGWLQRIVLAGTPKFVVALQRLGASAFIDLVELLPSLLLIVLVYGTHPADTMRLIIAVALGLVFANALGILIATFAGSLAETALIASVAALLLLHAGGVFRTPDPGSLAAMIQRLVPFHYMHGAIQAAVGYR
ncbi:MAG TPA: ABC transporter permease [Gemmatimonadales bacterium]|jgi:hypothetical protein